MRGLKDKVRDRPRRAAPGNIYWRDGDPPR
jgi:hypothetical protein